MLNAIIVDDERNSRLVLRELIQSFCPTVKILAEAANVEEAYTKILDVKPDLVFLDIQMPTGNGFTLLEKFEDPFFDVIFVTSFDQYAISAIKFNALDYLLKPVDIDLLKLAVAKAEENLLKKIQLNNQIVNVIQSVDDDFLIKKIALHNNDIVRYVKISEIVYIKGEINYSNVYTLDGEKYNTARTLKEFEADFGDFPFFIRIHKGAIINTNHIKQSTIGDPLVVEMIDGIKFEASRRRKVEVLDRLK